MSVWLTCMVGIPTPSRSAEATASSRVHAVADWARSKQLVPAVAVAAWAEAQAAGLGHSLRDRGLRLFASGASTEPCPIAGGGPSDLGHLYETLLAGDVRKRGGVHLTPADIATHLVALLADDWVRPGARVLDPSVGGGAFLIAAADALVAAGVPASEVINGLLGIDHDPAAVAVAEAAISLWGCQHGVDPEPITGLRAGDGLLDELPTCDIVVGNPPFLNQLRTQSANAGERRDALRERWGDLVTAYTDEAWLFLAAALGAVAPGGQLVMVQPVSVLAARHGGSVREQLALDAELAGLWISDGRVFDASVEVCAPLLRRVEGAPESKETAAVRRWRGRNFEELAPGPSGPSADEWGRLGAAITGIPEVRVVATARSGESVADLASVTAGFRDQFYGLAPYVNECPDEADRSHVRPLATVGMLDPFRFRWGTTEFRFAGERYRAPVLDAQALDRNDPELGRWVDARHRPKVLIATQTKVVEAWVDESGTVVPATPTISLEPHDPDDADALWRMLALLMTPAVSADVAAACFGTALSIRALKVSARDLAELPLPRDRAAWNQGAALAQSIQQAVEVGETVDGDFLRAFSEVMHRSFGPGTGGGAEVEGLTDWWRAGWPQR